MGMIAAVVPSLTLLVVTLLAVLPWGIPVEQLPFMRYLLPMLPYTVVHFWMLRRPAAMPPHVVFLAGLVIDVVTRGPLGLWPLVYLTGRLLVGAFGHLAERDALTRWLGFAATVLVLGIVQWGLASGYYLRRLDAMPILHAVLLAGLSYPLIVALLRPLASEQRGRENPSLSRGS